MRILIVRGFDLGIFGRYLQHVRKQPGKTVDLLCTCREQRCKVSQPELYDTVHRLDYHIPPLMSHWRLQKWFHIRNRLYLHQLKKLLSALPKYDVCHIHFLMPEYGMLTPAFRSLADRLILTIWGSDYYRATETARSSLGPIITAADVITFGNERTRDDFARSYPPPLGQARIIRRFGLEILDRLRDLKAMPVSSSRKALDLPEDAVIVACGTNNSAAQQHREIISSLLAVRQSLPEQILFVFPMTYGHRSEYRDEIAQLLRESGLPHRVFGEYLDDVMTAHLRRATDILIQVQLTDQLSGAMQEHLYAGSVVITGSWLPYEVFDRLGVSLVRVPEVTHVGEALAEVAGNIQQFRELGQGNGEKIWGLSSCEAKYPEWLNLYADDTH